MISPNDWVELSSSQIDLAENCLARWGAKYLGGLEEPETDALREGKLDHGELEQWQLHGKKPSRPRARMGVKWAGVPRTRNVELPFSFMSPHSKWRGFIDQIYATHGTQDFKELEGADHIVIRDWKTTSNIAYAKTLEELFVHSQPNIYGYWVHQRYAPKTVTGVWAYLPTGGTPEQRVFGIEKQQCTDVVEGRLGPLARRLQVIYDEKPDWKTLDKNTDFCHSFGRRCPRYEECKPERKRSFAILGDPEAMADFKKSMTATFPGGAEKKGPTPPAKKGPTPPSSYKMKNEIPSDLDNKPEVDEGFVNPGGGKLAADPEEAATNQNIKEQAEASEAEGDELDALVAAKNTAELKRIGLEIGAFDEDCRSRAPALRDMIRARRVELAIKGGETVVHETGTGKTEAAKKGPKAPAKKAEEPTTRREAGKRPVLFINCAPDGSLVPDQVVLQLNEIVDAATKKINAEHPEHPRDYRDIEFGKGPAVLACAVLDLFEAGELSADVVVCDARTDEGRVLLNTLRSICAKTTVRGF